MSNRVRMSLFGRILAAVFLSAASTSFAWEQSDRAVAPEKASFWCVDAGSGKTLFTNLDIVRFDWDRQIFELTRERSMDLMSLKFPDSDFILRDAEGVIYRGTFTSGLSASALVSGPILIDQIWSSAGDGLLPLYQIREDYDIIIDK
jgi:hypothetical protein